MQLGASPGALPRSASIPDALRVAATRLGHRPAVTVIRPGGREEQGFASLLRWTAKGAHLLELEALTEPGDALQLGAAVDWVTAAVAYASWWAGLVLDPSDPTAPVAVIGADADRSPGQTPERTDRLVYSHGGDGPGEAWTGAVQAFPDQPPPPRGDADTPALRYDGRTWTQTEMLAAAGRWGDEGVLGISSGADLTTAFLALVRPLRVGRPTVVLAGDDPEAARAERVDVWA